MESGPSCDTPRLPRSSCPTSPGSRSDGVTAANGGVSSWNTTGIASGSYYLSGYIYIFSMGQAVYSHLVASIIIT